MHEFDDYAINIIIVLLFVSCYLFLVICFLLIFLLICLAFFSLIRIRAQYCCKFTAFSFSFQLFNINSINPTV